MRDDPPHQIDEVVEVESIFGKRRRVAQRVLEALDRVPPALDVRIVGGEEAHPGPVFAMIQPTGSCG